MDLTLKPCKKRWRKISRKRSLMPAAAQSLSNWRKICTFSPAKNPVRKIKEAILTWRMERQLSKRRIMELYLNVVEWGDGIFGIEAAGAKKLWKKRRRIDGP
jgi:monofunctional biosynthetic peptidoglycan transglycosylase